MRAALGVYDVYRGSADAAIANAVQVPVNDPLLLIPAMAYVTRNLGFGVTCAVSYRGSPRHSGVPAHPPFPAILGLRLLHFKRAA
jgi:hypothetical protein